MSTQRDQGRVHPTHHHPRTGGSWARPEEMQVRAKYHRDRPAEHQPPWQGVRTRSQGRHVVVSARAAPESEPVDQVPELPQQHHGQGRSKPVRSGRGADARHPWLRFGGERGERLHRPKPHDRDAVHIDEPPRSDARDGPELAPGLNLTAQEQFFTLYDVWAADEAFITGSAAEIAPVVEVDGRTIGDGKPGQTTKKIMKAFRDLVMSTGTPI